MMPTLSLQHARCIAVRAQALTPAQTLPATPQGMLMAFRQLGCVQLDPISHIAKTHQLVLRNRTAHPTLTALNRDLDQLLWQDRSVFEYWAHCASMVLTEDYGIHAHRMNAYLKAQPKESAWATRTRAWIAENKHLADHILKEIKKHGALPSSYFEDTSRSGWHSTGWNSGRNINQMLDFFWLSGRLNVAGRKGNGRVWDLAMRHLPEWTPRQKLTAKQVEQQAVEKALRALGVGTPQHINLHFVRGRYPTLKHSLLDLEQAGKAARVHVEGVKGEWWLHSGYAHLLSEEPSQNANAKLLSPFDNLICDRKRTQALFHFDFTIEIYVPKEKRKFGYYVLPILYNDQIVGRVDSTLDKDASVYRVHKVYAEPDAPMTKPVGEAVAKAIDELGAFLGANKTNITKMAKGW